MILHFGKYRGWPIAEVPADYLEWLLDTVEWLKPSQRQALRDELARRRRFRREREDPTPPPVMALPERASLDVAREIIAAGRRQLAHKAHPDAGGTTEAMTSVNVTADWLIELIERIAS
jgi:hypothetical protein